MAEGEASTGSLHAATSLAGSAVSPSIPPPRSLSLSEIQWATSFGTVARGLIRLLSIDSVELWAFDHQSNVLRMLTHVFRKSHLREEQSAFRVGQGIVGRVYVSGRAEWHSDLRRASGSLGPGDAAHLQGIRGAAGICAREKGGQKIVVCLLRSKPFNSFSLEQREFIATMVSQWIGSRPCDLKQVDMRGKQGIKHDSILSLDAKSTASVFPSGAAVSQPSVSAARAGDLGEDKSQATTSSAEVIRRLFEEQMGAVAQRHGLDGAEIWVETEPASGIVRFVTSVAARPGDVSFEAWSKYSRQFIISPGSYSMVGRVIQNGLQEWQSDVSALNPPSFIRSSGAQQFGIRGMAAICGTASNGELRERMLQILAKLLRTPPHHCNSPPPHAAATGLNFVVCFFSRKALTFTESVKSMIMHDVCIWAMTAAGSQRTFVPAAGQSSAVNEAPVAPAQPTVSARPAVGDNLRAAEKRPSSSVEVGRRKRPKRVYECNVCGKPFHKKGNWQAHLRIHTKEKPFACTVCGRRFTQKSNMKRHMLKIHKISGDSGQNTALPPNLTAQMPLFAPNPALQASSGPVAQPVKLGLMPGVSPAVAAVQSAVTIPSSGASQPNPDLFKLVHEQASLERKS